VYEDALLEDAYCPELPDDDWYSDDNGMDECPAGMLIPAGPGAKAAIWKWSANTSNIERGASPLSFIPAV